MQRAPSSAAGDDATEVMAGPLGTVVGGRAFSEASRSAAPPPSGATLLTDTQLLQLSLHNAMASAAAGKAAIAANYYALVIKIIFRKCFLLEELVLLALAMGHETRPNSTVEAPHATDDGRKRGSAASGTAAVLPPHCAPSDSEAHEQLMDPLASIGTLLPPGLDAEDDEEFTYCEEEQQREPTHPHGGVLTQPGARNSASTASPVSSTSPTAQESTPGYDAATARWIACLLAKVHPDALPITTLEKICKVPLRGSPTTSPSSSTRGTAAARRQVANTAAATGISSWSSVTEGNNSRSTRTAAVLPLLPSLKSSPTSPSSSSSSAGRRGATRTGSSNNKGDAADEAASGPFTSLSLLFATLIWDVACALWNEGFVEDAHQWLSSMDVRRLWKLYNDVCHSGEAGTGGSHAQSATRSPSTLFAFRGPPEESVRSSDRACALSWPAVLAESCTEDASPPSSRPPRPSAAVQIESGGAGQGTGTSEAPDAHMLSSPGMPPPRQGILLSALAHGSGPLPMTGSAACFTNLVELEVGSADKDTAMTSAAQSSTEKRGVEDGSAAVHVETRTSALASFVRRLARRASALRDVCGLMIACETAEDVFYVMYALSGALATQQSKVGQQQERQRAEEVTAAAGTADATIKATVNGGLSELLIIANLLLEFFIAKRAQQVLLEEGGLDELASGSTDDAPSSSSWASEGRWGGAEDAPCRRARPHQRRTDRAVRRACDEIVCAFTNGHCLTLYALESYGIPPTCDGDVNTAETQLLASELPYAVVNNVLSSTLNYSTRYLFSKVYHGVMGCRAHVAAERHGDAGVGGPSWTSAAAAAAATASVLRHPNRTRRATDEEKERRRAWAMSPAAAPAAATAAQQQSQPPHAHASPTSLSTTITTSVHSVAGDLLNFMKKTVVSRHDLADFAPATVAPASRRSGDCNYGCKQHHQDVRPSFSMSDAPGGEALVRWADGGGYAQRLAAARREHNETTGDGSSTERVQLGEATPWSSGSPRRVTSNNSNLADASRTSGAYHGRAGGDARSSSLPCRTGRGRRYELRTRGAGAAELMLPSSSTIAVSLLAEENEMVGLVDAMSDFYLTPDASSMNEEASPSARAVETVVHTTAAHLQSRSPTEAVSLRLLALLYRYPQLHVLEPVTASHVDLVAKELSKALHILQTAMRGHFGDGWWRQWRSRREDETQRYYARALEDAQRGGYPLTMPATALPTSSPKATGAAGVGAVQPKTMGMSAVQLDPSLLRVGAGSWPVSVMQEQGKVNALGVDARGCNGVPPPSAPSPSSGEHTVLSDIWCARTLTTPTDVPPRMPLHDRGGHFTGRAPWSGRYGSPTPVTTNTSSELATEKHGSAQGAGMLLGVDWDIPPAYTPEVSLDFSAFTTTSVETQESTRRLVESLQQLEEACGNDGDGSDNDYSCADATGAPGVSVLSRACRRRLHNELPLLQQYSPWRVIYSTRVHGISLSTLFANCRREAERQGLSRYAAHSAASTVSNAKPALLVLELPSSTTLQFSEDDAGVREAWAHADVCSSATQLDAPKQAVNGRRRHNKLFVGAFLSDLLRLESRRYYGNTDCFVFQLLLPGTAGGEETASGTSAAAALGPQLRVHRATSCNAQYINCRTTSIVIGGGESGSSIYLDSTLCHGATSACATFASPPLSTWVSTPSEAVGVSADEKSGMDMRQQSLCILNVEVIVIDT